jgi:hypothetical protein
MAYVIRKDCPTTKGDIVLEGAARVLGSVRNPEKSNRRPSNAEIL